MTTLAPVDELTRRIQDLATGHRSPLRIAHLGPDRGGALETLREELQRAGLDTPAGEKEVLTPLEAGEAKKVAAHLVTSPQAYRRRSRGVKEGEPALELVEEVAAELGPEAQWWTNRAWNRDGVYDPTWFGWDPVTTHDYDAAVVGQGNGKVLVLVAADDLR